MSEKSARRLVREKAVQVLFAIEYNREGREALIESFRGEINDDVAIAFFQHLIDRVIIHSEEFDKIIAAQVENWELERIAVIDRIILRLGLCEFLYFQDIPPKVTINEMIELGKEFSTPESGKFINGIMDRLLNMLKSENKIQKSGRGLVAESKKPN
jgi:transcription antitermination protein NusB